MSSKFLYHPRHRLPRGFQQSHLLASTLLPTGAIQCRDSELHPPDSFVGCSELSWANLRATSPDPGHWTNSAAVARLLSLRYSLLLLCVPEDEHRQLIDQSNWFFHLKSSWYLALCQQPASNNPTQASPSLAAPVCPPEQIQSRPGQDLNRWNPPATVPLSATTRDLVACPSHARSTHPP